MELMYDGSLTMPTSFVAMDEEEMVYVEGGGLSWATAKSIAITGLKHLLGVIIGVVAEKLVEIALKACAAWVKDAFETVILFCMCYPGKAVALGVAIIALGGLTCHVYNVGKKKGLW